MSRCKIKPRTRVLTGREARRYGERERQREQRQADIDRFLALTPEERAQRMRDNEAFQRIERNGITVEDLKRAEDESYKTGMQIEIENTMKSCYAAICLALHEQLGFGKQRACRILNAVDEHIVMTLTSADAIQEVYDTMGLTIDFREPIPGERISEQGA